MIQIQGLDHLVLRVIDLPVMTRFYVDVLGCSVERRQDAIGLVQLRAGAALIDLVPVDGQLGRMGGAPPGKEGRNLDHFCLRLQPFDEAAIRAHLAAHGVQAGDTVPRYGAEGEGPSIYLSDPEGNVVELEGAAGDRAVKPLTRAVLWGGLLAGTGDLVFALAWYGMKLKVFQTVAAGLIGREVAYAGGVGTFALGVLLHYGISLIWAALFCLVAQRLPALLRHATGAGLAYGVLVYFGMNHVVLPLSALHAPFWPLRLDAAAIAAHALVFGLPIALAARRQLLPASA